MSNKAYITPSVLKWARETAGMSLETAANKVSATPEKIKAWENGESNPTIRQAETLAKAYKRPFALFFLPDIPLDFQPLNDFRRQSSKPLSTASIFIIRDIQQKQTWISEFYKESGEKPLPFVGKFSIKDNPQKVADDILSTLNITPLNYSNNPIKEWIDKLELQGIFVSRTSNIHPKLPLDRDEIQGFAIADPFAPFVFINTKDWSAPQLFTLLHEIAHIWIAETGISNDIDIQLQNKHKLDPVELFCNEVAANVLMPTYVMESYSASDFETSDKVFKVARKLGVSSFAFLVRALNLNLISNDRYKKLKRDADIDFQNYLRKEEEKRSKKTIVNPYLTRLNKNSRLFTQIVLDSYKNGFIEPTIASTLLNTQTTKFPRFEALLYQQ